MKESCIRCVTLICYISFQLCNKLLQKKFGKVIGGGYLCEFEIHRENEKDKCNKD